MAESPAPSWKGGLKALRELAQARQADPDQPAALWELRGRLLDWLAEDPPAETQDHDATLWRSVLSMLAAASEPDPKSAAEALDAQAPLQIAELRLCRKVTGFGNFEPLDETPCRPRQAVLLYCEMTGLRYEDDGQRMALQARIPPGDASRPGRDPDLVAGPRHRR